MKATRTWLMVLLAVSIAATPGRSLAQEPSLKFLHRLQQSGYGDMAVEYLKGLDRGHDISPALREVWDLEMARSIRSAANEAFDAKERAQWMAESQAHLAKFMKEHADHSEYLAAVTLWSDVPIKRALELIREAKAADGKDPAKTAELLKEARQSLGQARGLFMQVLDKFKARLKTMSAEAKNPIPKKKSPRDNGKDAKQRAESNLNEALFQIALIDYYMAQTYLDPKSPEHVNALQLAAREFDDIFQANRANYIGIYAHMWHGKTTDELGDPQTAIDIYDEVLANAPDPNATIASSGLTELEPLFAQVAHLRLMILAKRNPSQFLEEANQWLKEHQRLKSTEGYQTIAMEVAKSQFARAMTLKGSEKAKRLGETLKFVSDMARIRSPQQAAMILLRLKILKAAGREKSTPTTFEEAVAIADAAAAGQQWDEALSDYQLAIKLAEKTDSARLDAVRGAIAKIQLVLAHNLFDQGKLRECLTMAQEIARGKDDVRVAAQAASLAVTAALNLYVAAPGPDKAKALEQLNAVAAFVEKEWPGRPEADDARMARGKAKLVVGQIGEALDIFERVNPKSERFPMAALLAGQNYWRRYLMEKAKPENTRIPAQMASDRAKAVKWLQESLDASKRQSGSGMPLTPVMIEAQLFLAEADLDGGRLSEAAARYRPLVDAVKAEKPKSLDNTTIRIFLGAIRAYTNVDELDKAAQAGTLLMELGSDNPQVNLALIEFARLLNIERKKANARFLKMADNSNAAEVENARKKLGAVQTLLGDVLKKLASRQHVSLTGMVIVGDLLESVGMSAEAGQEYRKILERTENNPDFAKEAVRAAPRVRARLIGVLRQERQFDAALKQVNQLISENPRALEPRMEKARILEAWAQEDHSHYRDAVNEWNDLRSRLQRIRGKKPPEYYEVMYKVAECLVRDAETLRDDEAAGERARQAEQVLKSGLILHPALSGPDMVARFKALLAKAIRLQGREPATEGSAPPQKKSR